MTTRLFQTHRLTEYTGQHGVTVPSPPAGERARVRGCVIRTMFPGDDAAASKACSDHRPIWIRVRVPVIDDD